jgi:hypothetical protein
MTKKLNLAFDKLVYTIITLQGKDFSLSLYFFVAVFKNKNQNQFTQMVVQGQTEFNFNDIGK